MIFKRHIDNKTSEPAGVRGVLLNSAAALFILLCSALCASCGNEFSILLDDPGDNTFTGIEKMVFWAEEDGTINYVYKDGTGSSTILTTTGIPLDIELYVPGNRIFWTEYMSSSMYLIKNADFSGSDVSLFISYPTTAFHGPTEIAVTNTGVIYWNTRNKNSSANEIMYSDTGTFSAYKLDCPANTDYTYSITIDIVNGNFYFTRNTYWDLNTPEGSGNTGNTSYGSLAGVYSTPINGTGPPGDSTPLRGIAVDPGSGYIFYATYESDGICRITRADLDFQDQNTWITSTGFDIEKIALDTYGRKIYWTSASDNSIWRADMDTQESGIERFMLLDSRPTGIAIAQ